jgi:YD repeat-containing protein
MITRASCFTTMSNALGQTSWTRDNNDQWMYFYYDAFGNLAQTSDTVGNAIQNQYDILGRKIQMRDPDQGTWNYQYDVLGQLIKQTDAMGQVTTMFYDVLGRLSTRTDAAQTTQWIYDQSTQGIGKLSSEAVGPNNQAPTIRHQYQYDSLGRSQSVTTSIVGGVGAGTYTSSTTYDSFSRPQTQAYPKNGLTLRYEYSTSSGQMIATKEVKWSN